MRSPAVSARIGFHCAALLAFAAPVTTWAVEGRGVAPQIERSETAADSLTVESVAMTVGNLDAAVDFYTRVLTFKRVSERELSGEQLERLWGVSGARVRIMRLRLGDEYLDLMQFITPAGRPFPADSRSNDHWFQHVAIIVSNLDAAYERLRRFNVTSASTGPQRLPDWNPNAGGIQAFYFRDPDGHFLEILAFPPDKGAARWHVRGGPLFLGIDHTAIVVSSTEASLRFYRDELGLRIAGASENYGVEQEHLNNVAGAHLRITSLRAAAGPGVEFLEYLEPRTGRNMPANTHANDLWYWQINLHAQPGAFSAAVKRLGAAGQLSPLANPADSLGWSAALIAHDPDGHASLLGKPR